MIPYTKAKTLRPPSAAWKQMVAARLREAIDGSHAGGAERLTIARRQVEDMGKGTPGHEKMDMDYVIFHAQPDYIIIYGTAFDWLSAFSYQRVDLPWTDDPELKAFLGVYKRQ